MNVPLPNSNPESALTPLAPSTESSPRSAASAAFQPDVLRSIKMHPVLASSVAGIAFVLLLLHALTTKPVYEAEAVISEQPELTRLFGDNRTASFDSARYDSFLQEQIQTMQRPDTIVAALNKLPRSTWSEYGLSEQVAVDGVLAQLKVGRVTTSYQVGLTLKGPNSRNVTSIVNEIAATYLNLVHKQIKAERDERTKLLAQEREQVVSELRLAQKDQGTLGTDLGMGDPDGASDSYNGELTSLRVQLLQARSVHDAAAARLASLSGQSEGQGSALAAMANEILVGDASLSALKASISERHTMLYAQMSGMTYENPLRQKDQEELTELDHSLDEATAKLRLRAERDLKEKLQADLQQTGYVQDRIQAQLSQRIIVATKAIPKLQRAVEISGNLKRLLNRQSEIDDAIRSLQLEQDDAATAHLLSPAQIPPSPQANRQHMLICFSLPLALLLGMTASVIARKCDPRIYTAADVEKILGFPPLATLRAFDEVSEEGMAEDVLRMAGGFQNSYFAHGVHSFLITTVTTDTTIEPLCRVLLESICNTGVSACRTTPANLFLPKGTSPINNSEFLSGSEVNTRVPFHVQPSFAMANLTLLHERDGLILIEAATLINSAKTEYIARCASATILVVESAITTKLDLVQAVALLKHIGVSTVGVVVQGLRRHYDVERRSKQVSLPCHTKYLSETFHEQLESLFSQAEASVSFSGKSDAGVEPQTSQVKSEPDRRTAAFADSVPAAMSDVAVLLADSKEFENSQLIENGLDSSDCDVTQMKPLCHPIVSHVSDDGPELNLSRAQINMLDSSLLPPIPVGHDTPTKHRLESHMNVESSEYIVEPETSLPAFLATGLPEERPTYVKQSDWIVSSVRQIETNELPKLNVSIPREVLRTRDQLLENGSCLLDIGLTQTTQNQEEADYVRSDSLRKTAHHLEPRAPELDKSTRLQNLKVSKDLAADIDKQWSAPQFLQTRTKWDLITLFNSSDPERVREEPLGVSVYSELMCCPKREDSSEIKQSEHTDDRVGMLTRRWCLLSRFQ